MYQPESPKPAQESQLPQELITMCDQAIINIKSALTNFESVLDSMDKSGVNDNNRTAYMRIMLAMQELAKHKKIIESYIH